MQFAGDSVVTTIKLTPDVARPTSPQGPQGGKLCRLRKRDRRFANVQLSCFLDDFFGTGSTTSNSSIWLRQENKSSVEQSGWMAILSASRH
jgi:hypothetical protein